MFSNVIYIYAHRFPDIHTDGYFLTYSFSLILGIIPIFCSILVTDIFHRFWLIQGDI